jgi:hypothetical protein
MHDLDETGAKKDGVAHTHAGGAPGLQGEQLAQQDMVIIFTVMNIFQAGRGRRHDLHSINQAHIA